MTSGDNVLHCDQMTGVMLRKEALPSQARFWHRHSHSYLTYLTTRHSNRISGHRRLLNTHRPLTSIHDVVVSGHRHLPSRCRYLTSSHKLMVLYTHKHMSYRLRHVTSRRLKQAGCRLLLLSRCRSDKMQLSRRRYGSWHRHRCREHTFDFKARLLIHQGVTLSQGINAGFG